jgi:hypothetical protein
MPQHESALLGGGQALHGQFLRGACFAAEEHALGIGILGRYLHRLRLGIAFVAVAVFGLDLRPADPAEGAIHCDPVDPGSKRGALLELLQPLICAKKRFLHNFLRVGFVAGDSKGHSEDSCTVGADKGSISVLVPGQHCPND